MVNEALNKISQVHKVDQGILELNKRFETIDPGKRAQLRFDNAKAEFDQADGKLKLIRQEVQDLELESKKIAQKMESESGRLYSGGVYNAKDAEAIDREIKNLKARSSDIDTRLLELWELLPPAQQEADRLKVFVDQFQAELDDYAIKYGAVKAEFDAKMARLTAMRRGAIQGCDPDILAKYDQMRTKRGGIGLALVQDAACTMCNSVIPKHQLDELAAGLDLEICEGCGRYLYLESVGDRV